jgi:hypothetical protein
MLLRHAHYVVAIADQAISRVERDFARLEP